MFRYLDNCPSQLGLEFQSRLRLVLGLEGGNQTIPPRNTAPRLGLGFGLGLLLGLGAIFLGGNCPATLYLKDI